MTDQTHYEYLCMTDHYWGAGQTVEEAKAKCREHGGNLTRHLVYRLPAESTNPWVDNMGQVRWSMPEDYDGPVLVELEVVTKRGVSVA